MLPSIAYLLEISVKFAGSREERIVGHECGEEEEEEEEEEVQPLPRLWNHKL